MLNIILLIHTLFPDPVAPAINKFGSTVKSALMGLPALRTVTCRPSISVAKNAFRSWRPVGSAARHVRLLLTSTLNYILPAN